MSGTTPAPGGGNRTQVRVILNLFPQIIANLGIAPDQVVEAVAKKIEAGAKAQAPILQGGTMIISPRYPGQLRDSIRVTKVADAHWSIGAHEEYAGYVEYGTRAHGGPQPYMTPAAHEAEPDLVAEMTKRVLPF